MKETHKTGHVTLEIAGQRYTAYYVVDQGKLRVSNEIGMLTVPFAGGSAPLQAEKLLGRLVREERGS